MKWQRIRYMPCTPLGERAVTGSEQHRALARRAAAEGAVLLKNTNACLPLPAGTRLAVFGKAQLDYIKSGGGSGDVTTAYAHNLMDGLHSKVKEEKIELFEPLCAFYRQQLPQKAAWPGSLPEPELPPELLDEASTFTDTAVIALCRFSGEAGDRSAESFYLSTQEKTLLDQVTRHFARCIVCLNIGGVIDTSEFKNNEKITAVLLAWLGGMEGGMAMADMLCGDACPNGRLTDTFAASLDAYPGMENFLSADDHAAYSEDIYVGYRYFETIPGAAAQVCYPFGFGLSYGAFRIEPQAWSERGTDIELRASVTNYGTHPGRQVVQVYCSAPQGLLGKAARSLVGFAKTRELLPGDREEVTIRFSVCDLASYDDTGKIQKSAYVLEKGDYHFYVGENIREAVLSEFCYHVTEDRIIAQLSPKCVPKKLEKRLRADGEYESLSMTTGDRQPDVEGRDIVPSDGQYPDEQRWHIPYCAWHAPTLPQLSDVWEGKTTLEAFMENLSQEQLVHLLGGQPNRGCANTFGIGNLPIYGIPNAMTADGPAGLRIHPECGVNTTAFPCATLLACTWDPQLLYEIGRAGAEEVRENGLAVWLTPAANIHRNPLCGRNFEYYSEDPLISGRMASAMVRGIQELGIAASLKHFACNNKEGNRRNSDSRVSERALREIYLKGFELCIKEAAPWTVMCSYNLLNGVRVSENRELLTDILREEWKYDGLVITDWYTFGVQYAEISAGADVKMGCGMAEHTMKMLREGKLSPDVVRTSARRVLEMLLRLA